MFAVFETGGKQYKVSVGDKVKIEKISGNVGDNVVFDKILAIYDNNLISDTNSLSGKTINATIIDQNRDKKIIVYKYKRKSGYHKKNGHRQPYTKVEIKSIN